MFYEVKRPLSGLAGYLPGIIETVTFYNDYPRCIKLRVREHYNFYSFVIYREAEEDWQRKAGMERTWTFSQDDFKDMDALNKFIAPSGLKASQVKEIMEDRKSWPERHKKAMESWRAAQSELAGCQVKIVSGYEIRYYRNETEWCSIEGPDCKIVWHSE